MILLRRKKEDGSALMMALGVISILSLIAANVLMSSTTRYNTTSKQVKCW